MSIEKLKKWSSEFRVLSDPFRLAILFTIYGAQVLRRSTSLYAPPSLTFTELGRLLKVSASSTLAYHLAKLVEAGLLEKIAAQDKKSRKVYPIYRLSHRAIELIEDFDLKSHIMAYLEEEERPQNS